MMLFYLQTMFFLRKALNKRMFFTKRGFEKSTYVSVLLEREVLFLDKFGCKGRCFLVNSGRQIPGKTLQIVETYNISKKKKCLEEKGNFSPK